MPTTRSWRTVISKQPPTETLPNAFIFRYSVSGYVVALRCIKEGGAQEASARNIGNQIIDATIAAYATYFDGFMSEDKRAQQIYETAGDLLKVYHHDIKRSEGASDAAEAMAAG